MSGHEKDDESPGLVDTAPVTPEDGPPRGSHAFVPGDFVASRYRVVRFIARGGAGEVYEVEDTELRNRVALKTLRGDMADDPTLLERFRSEITLARRVTHANVCRTFDVGFHGTARGRIPFLTMELLDGESLRSRVRREGRMTPAQAEPIAAQMVAGLAAAHGYGIVHRDFKSDNVMLVADRVVVTDFGLARATDAQSTMSGRLLGTPAYMAPEQVQGGEVDARADVYALGVVLYEMMTGVLPFSGDSPAAVALQRLTVPPRPPRALVPSLDRRWEQVILRCLEREPAKRFASVREVSAALAAPAAPPRRIPIGWLAVVATIAVGAGVWLLRADRPRAVTAPARPSVAVLALRNLSGKSDAAWLGTAIGELLGSEVSAGEQVRRIPDESVGRVRRELQLPDGGTLAPDVLSRLRALVDADYVLGGSYLSHDGTLRLDVSLQDTRTGDTVVEVIQSGADAKMFELVAQAGERLRARLNARQLSAVEAARARASLPDDAVAARAYAEGLQRLRLLDARGARPLLERATAAEPEFPLAHAALSEAWRRLGNAEAEQREALLAFDRAGGLPRAEQLLVEANLRVARKEWARAVELYRSLHDFYPESIDYGVRLARVQVDASRGRDALATVESLHPATPDARIELARAYACQLLADYPCVDAAAARAHDLATRLGGHELAGDALLLRSYAAMYVGEIARAERHAREAAALFATAGNPISEQRAIVQRARVLGRSGDLPGARRILDDAVAICRQVGDDACLARARLTVSDSAR